MVDEIEKEEPSLSEKDVFQEHDGNVFLLIIGLIIFCVVNFFLSGTASAVYEYWTLVRLIYTITALYLLFKFSKVDKSFDLYKLLFVFIAILFNPIFLVELNGEVWAGVHMFYGLFLIITLLEIK